MEDSSILWISFAIFLLVSGMPELYYSRKSLYNINTHNFFCSLMLQEARSKDVVQLYFHLKLSYYVATTTINYTCVDFFDTRDNVIFSNVVLSLLIWFNAISAAGILP